MSTISSSPLPTPVPTSPPLRSQLEFTRTPSVRWSAVIAGVFMTAAVWLVLHLFGMGVGMTAVSPGEQDDLASIGIGVGVWSVIAPIIALFIGGLVVSRLAPTPNALNRAIHGGLVWSATTVIALAALFMLTAAVVRGATSTGAQVVGAAAESGAITWRALGIDAADVLGPINQRLTAEGKPAVTAAQLEQAMDGVVRGAVRDGRLDRATIVNATAAATPLSTAEVNELADRIYAQYQATRDRGAALGAQAVATGEQAVETTGKALVYLSIMLLLGMAAAVGGAVATGSYDRRRTVVA